MELYPRPPNLFCNIQLSLPAHYLQPEHDSTRLVVGAIMIVVLLVGVYRQAGHHMRSDQVRALIALQLILCAAEQPCQLPWLLCPLEAAVEQVRSKAALCSAVYHNRAHFTGFCYQNSNIKHAHPESSHVASNTFPGCCK
jgi:hypothetical protein